MKRVIVLLFVSMAASCAGGSASSARAPSAPVRPVAATVIGAVDAAVSAVAQRCVDGDEAACVQAAAVASSDAWPPPDLSATAPGEPLLVPAGALPRCSPSSPADCARVVARALDAVPIRVDDVESAGSIACAAGYPRSCLALGQAGERSARGQSASRDAGGEAMHAFARACDLGAGVGCALASAHAASFAQAQALLERGCALRYAAACVVAAERWDVAQGTPVPAGRAAALRKRACALGDETACREAHVDHPPADTRALALALPPSELALAVDVCDSAGAAPKKEQPAPSSAQARADAAIGCRLLAAGDDRRAYGLLPERAKARAALARACDLGDDGACFNAKSVANDALCARGLAVACRAVGTPASLAKACDLGVGDACFAAALAAGDDVAKAVPLFVKACELNDVRGCARAADALASSDPRRAVAIAARACDEKTAVGCEPLGSLLLREGPARDVERGAALLDRTCKAGDRRACTSLTWHDAQGPLDDEKARVARSSRCFDAGDLAACNTLADYLAAQTGDRGAQNQATLLYSSGCRASGYGSPMCEAFAQRLVDGRGAPPDRLAAASIFVAHAHALDPRDPTKAVELRRRACDLGESRGCLALATSLRDGHGVAADAHAAVDVFTRICEGERNPTRRPERDDACVAAGTLLIDGAGVSLDVARAEKLLEPVCPHDPDWVPGCEAWLRVLDAKKAPASVRMKFEEHACQAGAQPASCAAVAARRTAAGKAVKP